MVELELLKRFSLVSLPPLLCCSAWARLRANVLAISSIKLPGAAARMGIELPGDDESASSFTDVVRLSLALAIAAAKFAVPLLPPSSDVGIGGGGGIELVGGGGAPAPFPF